MAMNPAIRTALLRKLGVTPQRLSQLAKERKEQLPMSTEQAAYTIAHDQGVDLSKHLSKEEVAEIRGLVMELRRTAPAPPALTTTTVAQRKKTEPKPAKINIRIGGIDVHDVPGLTSAHAREAKEMAEKAYPALYLFENSARDVIERVLKNAFGDEWWTKAVPTDVQRTATKNEKAAKREPIHGRRGRPIDYVYLNNLAAIVKEQYAYFKDIFPRDSWFEELVKGDMNVHRRVVAHMNPLASADVKNVEAAFRKWARQLKAHEDKLP
jgi:hypothetical protein